MVYTTSIARDQRDKNTERIVERTGTSVCSASLRVLLAVVDVFVTHNSAVYNIVFPFGCWSTAVTNTFHRA